MAKTKTKTKPKEAPKPRAETNEEVLQDMHGLLARTLRNRMLDGSATAADLSVARQLLRDNNIDCAEPEDNQDLGELADALPFTTTADPAIRRKSANG